MIIFEQKTSNIDVLTYAIKHKLAVSFWYVGEDYKEKKKMGLNPKQNWRRVYPVALGNSKKTGKMMLRAYQYQGVTNSVKKTNPPTPKINVYKTFLLDEIKDGSVAIMYDKGGTNLQTFKPPVYTDDYGKQAAFKGANDAHMSSVDTYYDTSDTNNYTEPKYNITKRDYEEPNNEPIEEPELEPEEPIINNKKQIKRKQIPQLPKSEPISPEQPAEPINKINPIEVEPDEEDVETDWVPEPITESSGFLKWILNISYGTR